MQEQLISAEEAEELERLYQMPTTYRHVFIPRMSAAIAKAEGR